MTEPFEDLFAEESDHSLIEGLSAAILRHHGEDLNVRYLRVEERTVVLVWHVTGIIGNGGFNYLLEHQLRGDPDFTRTARAFRRIGCAEAVAAFQQAFGLFPESRPPRNIRRRLRQYRRGPGANRHAIDSRFWEAGEAITQGLARYIRSHREAFAHLAGPPAKRPRVRAPQPERPRVQAAPEAVTRIDLEALPHWARVAFAARCGRHVFPLFRRYWPRARPKRLRQVLRALKLAEQSAAQGKPAPGLKEAKTNAVVAAGAALFALYGFATKEPLPADGNAGTIASFVAKVAEHAAAAALAGRHESADLAQGAFTFALEALVAANKEIIREKIVLDYERICRVARRARWGDRDPVAPTVFSSLSEEEIPRNPWWKFW
jgi:hypothetical protein